MNLTEEILTNFTISNDFNHDSDQLTVQDQTLNTPEKICIFIFWFLIMFPGNGLLLGLIQFDRLGGDPLKRRILDQVSFQSSNPAKYFFAIKSIPNHFSNSCTPKSTS